MCVHVGTGVCWEILVHTGVCPQSGSWVLQSQEATKEETFKELKPLDRRGESLDRQDYPYKHSGCNPGRESE